VPVRPAAALAAAACAAWLAASAVAAEPPRQVQLPLAWVPITRQPPLTSDAVQGGELRIPRPMTSDEQIRVGVDETGAPVSVDVQQRLRLRVAGDYTFIVLAPARDVLPGPGTESDPGFLRGAILWQGFSPGRRTLVAIANLVPRLAAPWLPLRVSVRTTVDGVPLRTGQRRSGRLQVAVAVENRTAVLGVGYAGRVVPREVAGVLDQTRAALLRRRQLPLGFVDIRGEIANRRYRVDAGFRIHAELVFPAGRIVAGRASRGELGGSRDGRTRLLWTGQVGAGAPLRLTNRLEALAVGLAPPRLVLRAMPVLDVPGLRPPQGGSWVRAVRERLVDANERNLLTIASKVFLRLARTTQYQTFLANPDAVNAPISSRSVYVYSSAAVRAPIVERAGDSGLGPLAMAAVVVGAVLAAGGLLVLWAHL
jgi:hypothetical protein